MGVEISSILLCITIESCESLFDSPCHIGLLLSLLSHRDPLGLKTSCSTVSGTRYVLNSCLLTEVVSKIHVQHEHLILESALL